MHSVLGHVNKSTGCVQGTNKTVEKTPNGWSVGGVATGSTTQTGSYIRDLRK